MKAWRWLLVLPLIAALASPALGQERNFSRGGAGNYRPGAGHHGDFYGGGFLPGLLLGGAAAAAHARDQEFYDPPPRPRHIRRPPPDWMESDEAPPPRHRPHRARPVVMESEAPPRRKKPPPIFAPARARLPALAEQRLAPDEILVAFQAEKVGQAQDFARGQKLDLVEARGLKLIGVTVYRLKLPRGGDLRKTLRRAGRDARLAWAQPNYYYQLQEPDAPASSPPPQPETKDSPAVAPAPEGYAGAALNLAEAHKRARGQGVAVAVIDSQVDAAHPELAGVAVENFDAIGTPGAAHTHGTAMAGAISGHVKLAGAAPAARLLAVRAFDPGGGGARGATLNILAGLDWAADKGAKVVSMSFAGPPDPLMEKMVLAATGKGMVVIAAAGNEGPGAPPQYPGAYAPVIAVGAVDENAKIYSRGNRGAYIKLAAPGVDVLAAAPNGGYDLSTGTSIACAEISGVAALVLEKNPSLDLAALRKILRDSARKIVGEADLGEADAAAALARSPSPLSGEGVSR